MKKLLKWTGIGFGVLIGLVILVSLGSEDTTTQQPTKPSVTTQKESPTTTEQQKNIVGTGQEITVGEVRYIVNEITVTNDLAPKDEYSEPVNANGKFVIVPMRLELIGKESGTIDKTQFKLKDSEGRSFEPTGDFNVSLWLSGDDILLQDIHPNVPINGTVIFDVAPNAGGFILEINDLRMINKSEPGYVTLGL